MKSLIATQIFPQNTVTKVNTNQEIENGHELITNQRNCYKNFHLEFRLYRLKSELTPDKFVSTEKAW